ncbi:MAG: TIGR04282 family arsenosugar biosynthesis glycosyltransferase [Thermodesulfobacteriota bacterium]
MNDDEFVKSDKDDAIVLFVKTPVKGAVKTRLAASLGDAEALALYQCFVADALAMLTSTGRAARIYFYPAGDRELARAWLGGDWPLLAQTGESLGERMKNALTETFAAGFSRALVVGSDLPDLPAAIIHETFDLLRDHAAVIGPARDGGYYLIGFTAAGFLPEVFDGITWGTGTVLSETLRQFDARGITPRMLPVWRDMDTIDDLKALESDSRECAGPAAHTRKRLRNMISNRRNS